MLSGEEVAKHSSRESCWVILNNKAYDVTDFLDEHPGGSRIILKYAGKDATAEFEPIHPPDALASLPPDKHLGDVDPSTVAQILASDVGAQGPGPVARGGVPPLAAVVNIGDIERVAEKALKLKAWAYYKSAADDELSAGNNEASWSLVSLRPRVLIDVTTVDISTSILGFRTSLPVFICPAALGKLAHPEGEKALVRAAGNMGAIYMVSSNASCSLEEIADVRLPDQSLFFQLYVNRDRSKSEAHIKRVEKAGYKALVLTVDAPVPGKRTRDERAKMADLSEQEMGAGGAGTKPQKGTSVAAGLSGPLFSYIDASLNWSDLAWLRKITSLPIIIKGIQTAEDAALCAFYGVQGIFLSNHGGRQVDGSPSSLETLLEVRRHCPWVLNQCEVYLDGGVRKGTDAIKAVALGAKAVGIGRPAMYSLIWGDDGVSHLLTIFAEEVVTNMRLLGVHSLSELGPQHVNTKRLDAIISDDYQSPTSTLAHSEARAKL